jgi:hypothetical protein
MNAINSGTMLGKILDEDETGNDNGVTAVNSATYKNFVVKSITFTHRDIHKYTCTTPKGKTHNKHKEMLYHHCFSTLNSMKIGKSSFEDEAELKYLGPALSIKTVFMKRLRED